MLIILSWSRNISRWIHTSDKALRHSFPIILRKSVLICCKAEFAFFSIWVFFHKYSRFTGQKAKGKAISLWIALSVSLVSWYIYSTTKRLFTGRLRIVVVFAVLTISPLISESLLGNTLLWQSSKYVRVPFHK